MDVAVELMACIKNLEFKINSVLYTCKTIRLWDATDRDHRSL